MEVWLNSNPAFSHDDIDFYFTAERSETSISIEGGYLYRGNSQIGAHVHINSEERQQYARSLAGTVEWIYLTFEDWSMIPIENVVAACDQTPTRIAAEIIEPLQAHGAGFALEIGVDALVCSENELEASLIVKSLRNSTEETQDESIDENHDTLSLSEVKITSIESGHTGDRVCIDLTSLLEVGEGLLIGSTARSLALIHGETIESTYVPKRPFRVNAGSVEAYTLMADGSTKYLSELISGDKILVVSMQGITRICTIGRLKIETRPFILLRYSDEKHNQAHVLLQQAETVRVLDENGAACSVTELSIGDVIIAYNTNQTRHIGVSVSAASVER
ncbi:MAG: hypothetical protein HN541_06200 [Euryarchaeota archaeon]|mgnify:FL=1|jgi:3-dehydroquinate synthase II|nr:hypothetical protein [Euryarchaeota archaeon]